jgi:hypothetical protein
MVWDRLPKDVQKAILAMICFLGGASASCRIEPPVVCDPPPPPSVTPMICDPPPPPSVTAEPEETPTATSTVTPSVPTPMICDPPPPPPVVTVAPGQRFTVQTVQVKPNASPSGVTIVGTIIDQYGQPLAGLPVIIEREGQQTQITSDYVGAFFYSAAEAGTYTLSVAGDETSRLVLNLNLYDQATVDWEEIWEEAQAPLPLAEIRTVGIVWLDGLTFAAETPWPSARYRWSVSSGELVGEGEKVVWQPPAEPGRYLLQVVADWGRTGLAVDAVVLTVEEDGSVTSG